MAGYIREDKIKIMNEEKRPQSFSDFFQQGIEKLRQTVAFNKSKLEVPIKNRISELQDISARGHRARGFVDSAFWKEDLLPWLKQEANGIRPWSPGKPFDPFDVKANVFYDSGKVQLFGNLLNKLISWSQEGMQADKEMEFELKKLSSGKIPA